MTNKWTEDDRAALDALLKVSVTEIIAKAKQGPISDHQVRTGCVLLNECGVYIVKVARDQQIESSTRRRLIFDSREGLIETRRRGGGHGEMVRLRLEKYQDLKNVNN